MNFFTEAVQKLCPDCQFGFYNNKIIQWFDKRPQPTEEEIQAKIAELEAAEPMRLLRIERDRLLTKYDWITIRAYSQGAEVPIEWQTYLQQLRDLPATAEPQLNENGELTNIIWPTPPE